MTHTDGTECGHCCCCRLQDLHADMTGSFREVSARIDSMERQLRNLTGMIRSLGGLRSRRGRKAATITRKRLLRKRKDSSCINSIVPVEVWERIFRFLPVEETMRVRLVCRRWKQVVDGCPALMRRAEVFFPEGVTIDEGLEGGSVPPVGGASFKGNEILLVDSWWPSIGQGLIRLRFERCITDWEVLARMLRETPNLRRLHLGYMILLNEDYPEKAQLSNLEELTINNRQLMMKLSCPSLKRLICWVQGEEVKWFLNDAKDTLEKLTVILTFDTLKALVLMKNLIDLDARLETRLEDYWYFLEKISKSIPKLKRLSISTITDQTECGGPLKLSSLRRFTELEYFKACGTYPNAGLLDFSDFSNPTLKELHFESLYFFDGSLEQGTSQTPNIRHVTLKNCKFENIRGIFTGLEFLHQSLQYLQLENVSVTFSNHIPTLQTFNALKCLRLNYLEELKEFYLSLIRACPNVEMLELDTLPWVDDEVIAVLCESMSHLTHLALSDCDITDSSITNIVENCTELRKFAIDSCSDLSEECLKSVRGLERYDYALFERFRQCIPGEMF